MRSPRHRPTHRWVDITTFVNISDSWFVYLCTQCSARCRCSVAHVESKRLGGWQIRLFDDVWGPYDPDTSPCVLTAIT